MPTAYKATATRIDEISESMRRFYLSLDGDVPLEFKPGQFLMADIPKEGGGVIRRAYSIASAPDTKGDVELAIKFVEGGAASAFFWNDLKVGGSFPARAPFGAFTLKEPLADNLVFVATGTGVAPLRSMIRHLYHTGEGQKRKITLILGVRFENEILFDAEWKELSGKHKFTYIPTISRPKEWKGDVGYTRDKVREYISEAGNSDVYAVGSKDKVEDLRKVFSEKGFNREQLHFEIW